MDLNAMIAKAEPNTVIQYVVYGEHTLGYLFKTPHRTIMLGVLHGSVLKGGFNDFGGPHVLSPADLQRVRIASAADFDEYRVCLPPNEMTDEQTAWLMDECRQLSIADRERLLATVCGGNLYTELSMHAHEMGGLSRY